MRAGGELVDKAYAYLQVSAMMLLKPLSQPKIDECGRQACG